VHFLLLSERPDRLLPTIRSRCQRVRFGALPNAALDRILARHGISEEARHAAIAISAGRADRALELCQGERALHVLESALQIDAAVERRDPAELLGLGEQLANADDRTLVLESLATFYRDVAACSLGMPSTELSFAHRAEAIEARARVLAPAAAAERVAKLAELGENFERNANPELALDGLLFQLGAV
jgi:DNA polymerase-3 subunit delta'